MKASIDCSRVSKTQNTMAFMGYAPRRAWAVSRPSICTSTHQDPRGRPSALPFEPAGLLIGISASGLVGLHEELARREHGLASEFLQPDGHTMT